MKSLFISTLVIFLSACTTTQVSSSAAHETPPDRLLGFQKTDSPNFAEIMIIRDKGIAASSCYYGVLIDQNLAARMDVSEKASFKVLPGERIVKIIRDPQGKGLCRVGDDQVEKKLTLQAGQVQKFRLTLDLSGQPGLADYQE